MKCYFAKRKLKISKKNDPGNFETLTIKISTPKLVNEKDIGHKVADGIYMCQIKYIGLEKESAEVFGTDSLQAIQLASNVEPTLLRLSKSYNIFWPSGENYFDDEE